MTVKLVEELYCDRCKKQFWRREPVWHGDFHTMEMSWMIYNNGSGSKATDPNRKSFSSYDHDLCNECTDDFRAWWRKGKEDD